MHGGYSRTMDSQLRARAADLGLDDADVSAWEGAIDDELVRALLASLVAFEDALGELAQ